MRTIYIDSDFKCHAENDGTMTPVETNHFDEICDAALEGYRFIPKGYEWTRDDGTIFGGEMMSPHINYADVMGKQLLYEQAQRRDMEAALELLGVTPEEGETNG